ncbi:MAG: hypothetical protein WAM53_13610 [Terrimicrobiaceae bacterium]
MSPRKFSICEVNFMNGRRGPLPFTGKPRVALRSFYHRDPLPQGIAALAYGEGEITREQVRWETAGVHITGIRRRRTSGEMNGDNGKDEEK